MAQDIRNWCQCCECCIYTPLGPYSYRPLISCTAQSDSPYWLHFSGSGPGWERKLFTVMTDVFSKFTKAVPTQDQKASNVAEVLVKEWFITVVCQRTSTLTREEAFKVLCFNCGANCMKTQSAPYHPQGNGHCERFNQTLHYLLRTLPSHQKWHWPNHLPQLVYSY